MSFRCHFRFTLTVVDRKRIRKGPDPIFGNDLSLGDASKKVRDQSLVEGPFEKVVSDAWVRANLVYVVRVKLYREPSEKAREMKATELTRSRIVF